MNAPTKIDDATREAYRIDREEIIVALHQYRNDLRWPPERDSIDRRLAMIDALIAKINQGAIQ